MVAMNEQAYMRLGWLAGHKVQQVTVVRKFLFLRLIQWGVRESWDGEPPFHDYVTSRWVPVWRLWS